MTEDAKRVAPSSLQLVDEHVNVPQYCPAWIHLLLAPMIHVDPRHPRRNVIREVLAAALAFHPKHLQQVHDDAVENSRKW